ncbi:methionine aminopeptidase 1B, chloroplastic isoform X2 [Brachypodium distachyon]|uniref:methionine aminopeptidase 1B, chloroplastic isoform X2 n=1 Tax=Brachypodium distachyon TaxID=15368 RepID=UPI0005300716|nr:methionine aminopeptidase 1B, chloroplastic isoform X2 [Brachypodium distachyon]|eukprot:XP_024316774.1 methionine aminopeptidase 1B, chloroplastic isoform X2 [Brachypodium distachyon]
MLKATTAESLPAGLSSQTHILSPSASASSPQPLPRPRQNSGTPPTLDSSCVTSSVFSNLRIPVTMSPGASCSGVPAPRLPAGRQTLLLPATPLFVSNCAINRQNTRSVSSSSGRAIALKRSFVVSGGITWVDGVEEELMELQKSHEQSSVKLKKRPPLRRGKVYPQLAVPEHIPRPSYVGGKRPQELPAIRQIHNAEGITGMKAACKLAARVLDFAGTLVKPSVTTNEIDRAVHHMIVEAGAYPSPLGYGGFPKSICTSVNECVCHGVPDSTQLQNGDIINIDVNVFLNGYHGGTSRTFVCGEASESIKHFLKAAEECLERGISVCRDGVNYRKIGKKISNLAYFYGYHVVERFVGHGIGTMLHSEPLILHHVFAI